LAKCPVCQAELTEHEPELTFLKETGLIELTEDQRIEYATQVIQALTKALYTIKSQQGTLNQLKLAQQFMNELKQNGKEIIIALMYTVKPEFRPAYYELLSLLSEGQT
jgi:DNA repair exonuclease SbcCD ATPase subunit